MDNENSIIESLGLELNEDGTQIKIINSKLEKDSLRLSQSIDATLESE